jgi:hypothetical protein
MAECTRCQHALNVHPGCYDYPDAECGECANTECDLFRVTLPLSELAQLTDAQVTGYARMNEARRARIARMYGVSA